MDEVAAPGLLHAVSRYRWSVLLIVVATIIVSTIVGLLLAPRTVAQATIGLTAPSSTNVLVQGIQGDASLTRYANQRALFATSDEVLSVAAQRLPSTSLLDLQRSVTVTPSDTSTSMVVQATASTPAGAVATVDAVVAAYRSQTTKEVSSLTATALGTVNNNIKQLQEILTGKLSVAEQTAAATTLSGLTRQASDLQVDSAVFGDGVQFVQAAAVDSAVTHRLPYTAIAIGALLGLALGATIAWLRADRNRLIESSDQAETLLGAPLLGEVRDLHHSIASVSDRVEVARSVRDAVVPLLSRASPGVLLVTGAHRRVGATTTAVGLAAAAAAEDLRVLLIDADPATHGLATALLDVPRSTPGLLEAASGDPADTAMTYDVEVGFGLKIAVMASGRYPDGAPTVTAAGLRSLFTRLRPQYDVIVVDAPTPPDEYMSAVIANIANGTVVVVPQNAPVDSLQGLRRHLDLGMAKISGYVFTHVRPSKRQTKKHVRK